MKEITEFFTPTKLAELKTDLTTKQVPYKGGAGWEGNSEYYRTSGLSARASQLLEVYDAREKLAQLSVMIEELKGVESKVEEIQNFIRSNDLESMVSFCAYGDLMDSIPNIVNADLASDAMQWAHSNHNC